MVEGTFPNAEAVAKRVAAHLAFQEEVRTIAKKYFMPPAGSGYEKDIVKLSEVTAAVEVAVSLMTVFRALITSDLACNRNAIIDLIFGLNSNLFWDKKIGYLMPLIQNVVNAIEDYQIYVSTPTLDDLKTKLEYHNKYACLDIFPAICGLLYGYPIMRGVSTEMKRELGKFIT